MGRKRSPYHEVEEAESDIKSKPLNVEMLIDNISPIEFIGREDGVLLGIHCTSMEAIPKRLTKDRVREEDGELVRTISYDYLVMGLLAHVKQLEKRIIALEKKSG